MPLQKFEITADVPEGFEATGEFRSPEINETILDSFGTVRKVAFTYSPNSPRIILRPVWQWPEFVAPGSWIAMDSDGTWHAFEREPFITGTCWCARTGSEWCVIRERPWLVPSWRFPPCTDWRQSSRQKPL